MKKTTIAFVNAAGNGVEFQDWSVFQYNLSLFAAGTKLRVTIENYAPQRSLKQNGVLHWYIAELAEECGMEADRFKARMGDKFLRRPLLDKDGEYIYDPSTGEVEMYVPSTSDLDTAEMAVYIDKIRLWGLEFLGVDLPLPDENYKIHFLTEDKKRLK